MSHNIECSEYSAWRVIVVTEEGATPRCCDNKTSLVSHHFGNSAFHTVNLRLDYLDDGLQESQLLLRGALKRLLIELDSHSENRLLQVLPE